MKRELIVSLLMLGASLAAGMKTANAAPLDVKPGLWETTVHLQGHGQMPIPEGELQKMTPQQRAAMAKIEARNNQPRAMVTKSCLTQERLDKDENAFLAGEPGEKCTGTLSRHTRTSVAGSRHCSSNGMQRNEKFEYAVQDRGHISGKLDITISDGTKTMSTKGSLTSRWISAACGTTR